MFSNRRCSNCFFVPGSWLLTSQISMNVLILSAKASFLEVGQAHFLKQKIFKLFFRPRLLTSQISMNGKRMFFKQKMFKLFFRAWLRASQISMNFLILSAKASFSEVGQAHFFKQKMFKLFFHPRLLSNFHAILNFVCKIQFFGGQASAFFQIEDIQILFSTPAPDIPDFHEFPNLFGEIQLFQGGQAHFFKQKIFNLFFVFNSSHHRFP